jgi:hypothetical protein
MSYSVSETVEDGIERVVYAPTVRRFQTPLNLLLPTPVACGRESAA